MCSYSKENEILWFRIDYGDFQHQVVTAQIPIGQLWIQNFVMIGTFVVVSLGSAFIIVSLLQTN
jgi:hypothetical protein